MDELMKFASLVTGPLGATALAAVALWKLWGRVEKMIDQLQTIIAQNTAASTAAAKVSEAQAHALEQLAGEVRAMRCHPSNGADEPMRPRSLSSTGGGA